MSRQHLVRIGSMGQVGRFTAFDGTRFARGSRVVCRTARGVEVGLVLASVTQETAASDGPLLRGVTVEDDLLLARLEKNRQRAFEACQSLLGQLDSPPTLMDVETLFDGKTLYFYFLGEVSAEVERMTERLATAYEAESKVGEFGKMLEEGCGPGCGTDEAAGCESGGCSTCALVSGCKDTN